jgi:hypothetical protein
MIAMNGGHAVLYLWVNSRVELFTLTLRLRPGRRFTPNTNSLLGLAKYSWIAIRVYETVCADAYICFDYSPSFTSSNVLLPRITIRAKDGKT